MIRMAHIQLGSHEKQSASRCHPSIPSQHDRYVIIFRQEVTNALKTPADLTFSDIQEIKQTLKRVEQKLDMLLTRLHAHGLIDEDNLERPPATRDWLKSVWPDKAWKRTHAI